MTPLSLSEALSAARETRALIIGKDVLQTSPRIFRNHFSDLPAMIIADKNTFAAAGQTVHEAICSAKRPALDPFIFHHPDLHAEHRFVVELEAALRQHKAIPIAVGSGTINDLTKLASHRTNRPYMCVATAASMDGYTAFGASITHGGSKQTFQCPAPVAVIADLNVIASSPASMNAWGYADLLAKVTAGADWILADALGVEAIDPLAWNIVQGRLHELVADPAGVCAGKSEAISRLIEGLMLGGFAMQAIQSSRPASGAEHQFSHLWDMQCHTYQGRPPSHGLKVGIGLLAATALYECLLKMPLDQLDEDARSVQWAGESAWVELARKRCGEGDLGIVAAREVHAKFVSSEQLGQQIKRLRAVWPELAQKLRRQLVPFATLKRMLETAGAATEPEQIGISRERLRNSFWQAFFIRRRFTVLDLAVRAGALDSCLSEIFGPCGAWPIRRESYPN